MPNIFLVLLVVFLVLTFLSLAVGVVGMGKGGGFNARYGNKLMRLRVLFQGLAVGSFVLYWLTR
jgi:Hypoxia induced protein conserved region